MKRFGVLVVGVIVGVGFGAVTAHGATNPPTDLSAADSAQKPQPVPMRSTKVPSASAAGLTMKFDLSAGLPPRE